MSRYSKKPAPSPETREEAMKIAKGTQKPGQTKEQTKLIAQGIQKGIDQYKKKQKAKTREIDKKLKAVKTFNEEGMERFLLAVIARNVSNAAIYNSLILNQKIATLRSQ